MADFSDSGFPCALTILIPLPTHRLASSALRALSVDAELSPLVRRHFSLTTQDAVNSTPFESSAGTDVKARLNNEAHSPGARNGRGVDETLTVLRTEYKTTTNRMLRVAVNGFMESLGVVLGVMEELDVDVLTQGD